MNVHAKFSPSQLSRIIACPGSVVLSAGVPQPPSSPYAAEGTFLHSAMDALLSTGSVNVTTEQRVLLNACNDYLSTLRTCRGQELMTHPMTALFTELHLTSDREPELAGTADVVILEQGLGRAHVIDWKFGGGVFVPVYLNPQFMAYALMVLERFQWVQEVVTHVVQPRLDNFDRTTYTRAQLERWYKETLAPALRLAERTENPILNPQAEACRWCRAAAICPARHAQVQEQASEVFALYADIQASKPVSHERIAEFLNTSKSLEQAIKAVKDYALHTLYLSGEDAIPGYKVVKGRGARKWKASPEAIVSFLEERGIDADEVLSTELKSVAEIERLSRTIKTDPEFRKLYDTEYGKAAVVPTSDPRPAIGTQAEASDVFAGYVEDAS